MEDYEASESDPIAGSGPPVPPGLGGDEVGGAYMTVSQQANEKAAAAAKEKLRREGRSEV